jgi:hypothetical protein
VRVKPIVKRIFVNIIIVIFASGFIVSKNAYSDDNDSEYSTYDDKCQDKYEDKKNTANKPLYDDQKYDQEGYNLDIQNNQTEYKDPYDDIQNTVTENQNYDSDSKVSKEDGADKNAKRQNNIRKYDEKDSDYNNVDNVDNVDKEHNTIDLQVPPAD